MGSRLDADRRRPGPQAEQNSCPHINRSARFCGGVPFRRPFTLQRLLPGGGRVASVMTRATFAAAIEVLRPRPGRSARPSRPDLAKRPDHVETRFAAVLSRSATASTPRPSSRSRMMLARSRSRTPIVADRDQRRSSPTTQGAASSRLLGRAIRAVPHGSPTRGILVDIYSQVGNIDDTWGFEE